MTNHESNHDQPTGSEAEIKEGLDQLEATFDYVDSLPQGDALKTKVSEILFQTLDGHVQNEPIASGGHTIPGTDEGIPGESVDHYWYVTEDKKTGAPYKVPLSTEFGRRLEAFVEQQRAQMKGVQEKEATQGAAPAEATILPFKKPAANKQPKQPRSKQHQPIGVVTTSVRRGVSRPQGSPEHQSVDPVMTVNAEQATELPEATQPVVSSRERGGATRPQGPSEHQSAEPQTIVHAEQPVELTETAKPAVTTRSRGGATRPQGPGKTEPLEPTPKRSTGKLELSDLVKIGKSGRAHVSGSHNSEGRSRNGQFLSKYEIEQIEAHEKQIRKGLGKLAAQKGVGKVDKAGRAHRENGQQMSNKELAELLRNIGGVRPEQSAQDAAASDAELDAVLDQAPQHDFSQRVADMDPETREAYNRNVEAAAAQGAAARQSIRARFMRRLKNAGRHAYLAPQHARNAMRKMGEYLSDEEKGRRRGIVAGVVGVAAVGGAYLGLKYGGDLLSHTPDTHTTAHGGGSDGLAELLTGRGGKHQGTGQEVVDALSGNGGGESIRAHMTLHQGDTIWGDLSRIAAQHGQQLNDEQVHDLVGRTLHANGISWEDARHLPVGYHYDIPPEVREQLARQAA